MAERNWRTKIYESLPDRTDIVIWQFDAQNRIFTVIFTSASETYLDLDGFDCVPAAMVQRGTIILNTLIVDGKSSLDLTDISNPLLAENYHSIGWISGYGEYCYQDKSTSYIITIFSRYQNFFRKQSHAKMASTIIKLIYENYTIEKEILEMKKELKRVTENILAIHTAAMAQEFLHEIKNELMALQSQFEGSFSFMSADTDSRRAKDYRMFVKSIYSLQQRSTSYLRRTETDDLHLHRRDILLTIADAVKTNSVWAEKNGIALRNLCIGSPIFIAHDQLRLVEAFKNIIRNAIDAANKKHNYVQYIELTCDRRPGEVYLQIRDNGTGFHVDPETLFRPGYSTKRRGTGLGLAIAQSIIEKHRGKISARNIGNGSVFSITLPLGASDETDGV